MRPIEFRAGVDMVDDADLARWREFVDSRVEGIPGWLNAEAALLTAHLSRSQHALGLEGCLLEIGVYKGKYLSILYRASATGESVVGVTLRRQSRCKPADEVRALLFGASHG